MSVSWKTKRLDKSKITLFEKKKGRKEVKTFHNSSDENEASAYTRKDVTEIVVKSDTQTLILLLSIFK